MFSSIKFFFLSLLASASVLSLPLKERDVVAPPVTAPNATSTWPVGSTQTVVWNTSSLPPYNEITNRVGQVILGHLGGGGLNLMLDHPLATGFNITQGSVNVVVPNVPLRTDYIVVLMGDSGNASPAFAITSGSTSSSSQSSSSQSSSSQSSSASATTSTNAGSTTGSIAQSTTTPGSTSDILVTSTTTLPVINTSPSSTTPSSTTVVVLSSSQPSTTSTRSNGAVSVRHIGATCFGAALIVSGLLL